MGSASRPHWREIGGSHAQRDLFEQVYLDSLIRAGRAGEAVPILEARMKARPNVRVHRAQLNALRR